MTASEAARFGRWLRALRHWIRVGDPDRAYNAAREVYRAVVTPDMRISSLVHLSRHQEWQPIEQTEKERPLRACPTCGAVAHGDLPRPAEGRREG